MNTEKQNPNGQNTKENPAVKIEPTPPTWNATEKLVIQHEAKSNFLSKLRKTP